MKKILFFLIPMCILLLSMACVLSRFTQTSSSSSTAPLPTYTLADPTASEVAPTTRTPLATPTPTIRSATSTVSPSSVTPTSPMSTSTATGFGIPVNCDDLIQIEVFSAPSDYTYLNLLKANGKWLVLHMQLTNLRGETYNFLHENDFAVVGSSSGQTIAVTSTQTTDIEAYLIWGYSAYLVDPLPGGGTSRRIVAFDVDPSIKDWALVFTPKNSVYSTSPFCTVEIPLH